MEEILCDCDTLKGALHNVIHVFQNRAFAPMLIHSGNCPRGSFGIRIATFKAVNVSTSISPLSWRALHEAGKTNWLNEGTQCRRVEILACKWRGGERLACISIWPPLCELS